MVLLVSCLLLLMQLGSSQKLQDKEDNYGAILQVGFRTSFSCVGRVTGYYADIESGCQLYHMCDGEGRRFTHACPNATLFQQRMMICDHWYMVNCNNSEHDYSANLLIGQRDKPFVSAAEHVHHREPVKFFTIPQNPGSLQQPNWYPSVNGRRQGHPANAENVVHSNVPLSVSDVPTQSRNIDPMPKQTSLGDRQARNRNFNADNTFKGSPSPSYFSESSPRNPQYFQTRPQRVLPNKYTSNLFLQSLTPRTTTATIPNYFHNSQVQTNITVPSEITKTNTGSNAPANLEDFANIRISDPRSDSGQAQQRNIKDFSVNFGSTSTQSLPHETRELKLPDAYTNNPFFQSLIKGREFAEYFVTTPASTNVSIIQGSNTTIDNDNDLNNIVELHLLDPRRMFFIPGADGILHESRDHDLDTGNSTVLFISLPAPHDDKHVSHGVMHFRNNVQSHEGLNPGCPKCHPGFLLPGKCHPCVIIR